jgi:hypothetical protein
METDITRLIKAVLVPELGRKLPDPNLLRPGDVLTGRVVSMQSDQRALVDFGNFKARAHIEFPVQAGDRLRMSVVETGPKLMLRMLTEDPIQRGRAQLFGDQKQPAGGRAGPAVFFTAEDLKTLRNNIEILLTSKTPLAALKQKGPKLPEKIQVLFNLLVERLKPLDLDSEGRLIVPQLRNIVEDSGIFLEKRAAEIIAHDRVHGEVRAQPSDLIHLTASKLEAQLQSLFGKLPRPIPAGIEKTLIPILRPLHLEGQVAELLPRLQEIMAKPTDEPTAQRIWNLLDTFIGQGSKTAPDPNKTGNRAAALFRRDMKAVLAVLKGCLDETTKVKEQSRTTTRHLTQIRLLIDKMVSSVEYQQAKSGVKSDGSKILQSFTHLLPIKQDGFKARLKVFYKKKRPGAVRQHPHISILLEMDRMGMVRSDLSMLNQDLKITFYVDREAARKHLQDHFGSIREALEPWFQNLVIRASVSPSKNRQFDLHAAGPDLPGGPSGKVDIHI